MVDLESHRCDRSHRWELKDARGIFCAFVCNDCEEQRCRQFRAEIFTDADYGHDEPIDGDGFFDE